MIIPISISNAFYNVRSNNNFYEIRDCKKIVRIIKREFKVEISFEEAFLFWKTYSKSLCAGWINIDRENSKTIISEFEKFVEKYSK